MKTPKLKARRMYINPSDMIEPYAYLTSYRDSSADRGNTLPVAVIPLDDVEALVEKAASAFIAADDSWKTRTYADCIRAALAAIGIKKPRAKRRANK